MPAREKQHLFDFLDFPTYEILSPLKKGPKPFTELSKSCSLSKSNFNDRLEWLIKNGLIYETLINSETGRKRKGYALTDTGRRILELLEEIERVYGRGVGEDRELKEMEEDLREANEPK